MKKPTAIVFLDIKAETHTNAKYPLTAALLIANSGLSVMWRSQITFRYTPDDMEAIKECCYPGLIENGTIARLDEIAHEDAIDAELQLLMWLNAEVNGKVSSDARKFWPGWRIGQERQILHDSYKHWCSGGKADPTAYAWLNDIEWIEMSGLTACLHRCGKLSDANMNSGRLWDEKETVQWAYERFCESVGNGIKPN